MTVWILTIGTGDCCGGVDGACATREDAFREVRARAKYGRLTRPYEDRERYVWHDGEDWIAAEEWEVE